MAKISHLLAFAAASATLGWAASADAAVTVLGGVGPFFGSFEFIREQRSRAALE